MSLDSALASLADRLIAAERAQRNARLQETLRRNQDRAVGRGTLGAGFYVEEQKKASIAEFDSRVDVLWDVYSRIVTESRTAWSPELRDSIVDRIKNDVEADISVVEEMARRVIVPHGHGFDLFLRAKWPAILDRITAEIDLFGLNQTGARTELGKQLSAPRYQGPADHWRRSQEALSGSDPDFLVAAREAIHMVEGISRILVGKPNDTLGEAIKTLRQKSVLSSPISKQIELLWGLVSNLEGVRHGSSGMETPSDAEMIYVVDGATAVANLLLRLDRGAI